ncbi:uncharacterized protein LOC111083284 [Limulus polyphemus]|uniref:Uncharacterized protein LOC111083284 n=1 Tax=Limulus polyphemus TaxID=6850 RepID=A0ABM1RVI9_LIMPO|nr:uncharacterized protein LOC111083284 [Limulus polyphemus]
MAEGKVEPDMPMMETMKPTYRNFVCAPKLPNKQNTPTLSVDSGVSSAGSINSSKRNSQMSYAYRNPLFDQEIIIGRSVALPDVGSRMKIASMPHFWFQNTKDK